MDEQYCSKCGSKITECEAKFCPNCGGSIIEEKQPVAKPYESAQVDCDFKSSDTVGLSKKIDMYLGKYVSGDKKYRLIEMFGTFSGRLNRKRYFGRSLLLGAATAVIYIVGLLIVGICSVLSNALAGMVGVFLAVLMMVMVMLVHISLGARRCHDLDKSGWLYIAVMIPFLGALVALYLLFAKGTEGNNKYGEDISETEGW